MVLHNAELVPAYSPIIEHVYLQENCNSGNWTSSTELAQTAGKLVLIEARSTLKHVLLLT